MEPILIIGIIIFTGFAVGELCAHFGLPKVTGYIFAGLLLNPDLTHFIPKSFVAHTTLFTNIAISFITFSVGGTLFFPKIRSMGKSIILITLFEAEFAFLFVVLSFIFLAPLVISGPEIPFASFLIPLSLLLAALASPTDPSATLAVEHEYHAEGEVTSTIMGVAAFDDILGIVNYSVAVSFAGICILHQSMGIYSIVSPLIIISGSILLGCLFGFLLNLFTRIFDKRTEGGLITLIIGLLTLCFGLSEVLGLDKLLPTMTMGVIVVNYNIKRKTIFKILERYTEELIFVLFFTISAMHLNFSVLISNYLLILIFIVFRTMGKFSGTIVGSKISKASPSVQKYTAFGLIPQGGIVIGLALVIRQNSAFASISDIILNVIIGATIVHEIIGPVISKFALKKAGEITFKKI